MMPRLQSLVLGAIAGSAEPLARADIEVRLGLVAGAANRPLASLAAQGLVLAEDRTRPDDGAGPSVVRIWTATAEGRSAVAMQTAAAAAVASVEVGAITTRSDAVVAFGRLRAAGVAPAAIVEALSAVVPAATVRRWARQGPPPAPEEPEEPTVAAEATTASTVTSPPPRRGRPARDADGNVKDTRPAIRADDLRDLLAAAADALDEAVLRGFRLELPTTWPDVRRAVCLLPDVSRRTALVALLVDEHRRIAGER